ncbi:MAG: squalene--hopene cyclase, partial [Acidobacteriaceae bacterium]
MVFGHARGIKQRIQQAIQSCQTYLFSQQQPDGFWCGELEADTTLESDYILLHEVLGAHADNTQRTSECIREILRHQNQDGG